MHQNLKSSQHSQISTNGSMRVSQGPIAQGQQNLQSSLSFAYEKRKKQEEQLARSQNISSSSANQSGDTSEDSSIFDPKKAWNVVHQMILKPALVGILMGSVHLATISLLSHYFPKAKASADGLKPSTPTG